MRRLLGLLAIWLLALATAGCAGTSKMPARTPKTASSASSSGGVAPESAFDISTYGHEAGARDTRAIVTLIDDYYAAAASDDGARACSMIYSIFEEAIAEDYGQPPGPADLRGKTCAVVMSKFFKHIPHQPSAILALTRITGIRLKGRRGFVQLTSSAMPTGEIRIEREHQFWKIDSLIGQECTTCTANGEARVATLTGFGPEPPASETPGVSRPMTFSGPRRRDMNDSDEDPGSYDDNAILDYGHPADPADRLAITELARRYYHAAAAENGGAACSLLYSLIVESLSEESRQSSNRDASTCASVISNMFKQAHRRLAAAAAFKVTGVRVDGARAYVLLNFGTTPGPYTIVHRDGESWKMEQIFDVGLP
jgi:hypothetical protein